MITKENKIFERIIITVKEYLDDWYRNIDCQPLAQRLPVTEGPEKREGIIDLMIKGIDIGQITLVKNTEGSLFIYDSLDGGHRKRYIHGFYNNKFTVNGKYFNQLNAIEKTVFQNYTLSFVIYEPLDVFTRGYIFRALNTVTDVNHMEMLNSFGDIEIANLVRFTVRSVQGYDNSIHELFSPSANPKNLYRYLDFNNNRLKTEELLARVVFRYTQSDLLGASSDEDLNVMYQSQKLDMTLLSKKTKEHCDFLLKCAINKKTGGLTQQDFKMLSFLYFYMVDTYGKFKIESYEDFMTAFRKALLEVSDNKGKYGKIPNDVDFDTKARMVSEAFTSYLGAPHHEKKIKQTVIWLLLELDIKKYVTILDKKRAFSKIEREKQLLNQNCVCDIDNLPLKLEDAEAAHIISYDNGGSSTMENMKMVRKEHNRAMGTMNLEDYRVIWLQNNKKAS